MKRFTPAQASWLTRQSMPDRALVLRGHVLDMRGLDFLIIHGGRAYGLGLSVDTQAARDWAEVKLRRNPPVRGIPVLNLMAKRDAYKIGPFWLHHPKEAEQVRNFVEDDRAGQG